MGKYVNKLPDGTLLPAKGKAEILVAKADAKVIERVPPEYTENLVCVVENGLFEAAAWVYDEGEYQKFARVDGRPKQWLTVPNVDKLAR